MYQHDAANQLVTATDTQLGTTSYTYDGNGNLVYAQKRVRFGFFGEGWTYNQRSLIANVSREQGGPARPVAAYVYDGDGNRVQQIDYTGRQPITTTYYNDNLGLSQVLIAETHSAGSKQAASQTANLYGLDLISQDDGAQTRTLLTDGLGSVRQEMAGGALETATTYEPYGNILAQTGTSGPVYGFTGEQFEAGVVIPRPQVE